MKKSKAEGPYGFDPIDKIFKQMGVPCIKCGGTPDYCTCPQTRAEALALVDALERTVEARTQWRTVGWDDCAPAVAQRQAMRVIGARAALMRALGYSSFDGENFKK